MHGAEALHRHRHRYDHLATVVDPHHAGFFAVQRLLNFLIAVPVLRSEFTIKRKIAAIEPCANRDHGPFGDAWLLS